MEKEQYYEITDQLMRHEGLRLKPYRCPAGKLTIGYGRNLDDRGISKDEAILLLAGDIMELNERLSGELGDLYKKLNPTRQNVLINMAYNLGMAGFLGFKQMMAALAEGNFERAANDMLASKWARQVGKRAIELSEQMRKGW